MKLRRASGDAPRVEGKVASGAVPESAPKGRSLRDIVDRTRPYTMMYSGVEEDAHFDILYDMGVRDFLMSYFYVRRKRVDVGKFESLGVEFFIDSGAFTFRGSVEHQSWTEAQWEEYIESYLKWAEGHRSIIFAIAGLDLEGVVDAGKVQEWNERYFEPFMLRTGIPVCFVWHEDSKLSWEQYCQRYPYVGMAWDKEDRSDIAQKARMLKVAERHGALVHGMAVTQTSVLTQLPFYTVDSTTWLVGLQYGEVNWWTGTKMTRLKKDKWKGAMLPQIVAKGFDEQRLLEEDKEELIRVNVRAFMEAQEYVRQRLRSRMYWLRPEISKRGDLSEVEVPPPEWLETPPPEREGVEEYARKMNISTEADPALVCSCVVDMACFLRWDDPAYRGFIERTYTPELVKELHDAWVNRIASSDEERVEDLRKFYRECALGERDTLLVLGTNFDRVVRERDDYVDDAEYDYEDMTDAELNRALAKYLPPPKEGEASPEGAAQGGVAPEVDSLDDEIFSGLDIVPVRDEGGRLLKGQRRVRRPKRMYSDKYPKVSCDMCVNAQTCPEYKSGYVCAYNRMFERYDTRDMGDVIQAMQGIADYSLVRLQRAMLTETMNGGLPDPAVSQLMQQSMGLMAQIQRMYECGSQEVLRQTKVVRSDGTQEVTTQVSNPQRGGVLERIFGDLNSPPAPEAPPEPGAPPEAATEVVDPPSA